MGNLTFSDRQTSPADSCLPRLTQNLFVVLEVVKVDSDKSLLFVRGAVPGHPNGIVRVRGSVKA